MNLFGQRHVRRFAISADTGKIVATLRNGPKRIKELGEFPNVLGLSWEDFQSRCREIEGFAYTPLPGKRYDTDVIAKTPTGDDVTAQQLEGVYNDWRLLTQVCGPGTLEHFANAHELAVLTIARKMYE